MQLKASQTETPACRAVCYLVGQIHHAQVRLYFEAEGREAGHAVLRPGELVEDDGIFRVQLLLLPAQREEIKPQ